MSGSGDNILGATAADQSDAGAPLRRSRLVALVQIAAAAGVTVLVCFLVWEFVEQRFATSDAIAHLMHYLRGISTSLITAAVAAWVANRHYAEHAEKPFFAELVSFITGGPLVAIVLEGTAAVEAARQLIGATNPIEAAPGLLRGDFATEVTFNLVHGSDSEESAEREIMLWFPELT